MALPKQSACLSLFGNPNSSAWVAKNTTRVAVPWDMRMGDIPIRSIMINKIAAPSLATVLQSIWQRCGKSQSAIHLAGCDCFSGSYAVRPIRGGHTPSMHSYALAIDINAPANPLGAGPDRAMFHQDSIVVQEFKRAGWVWGGDWHGRPDPMHFQYAEVG